MSEDYRMPEDSSEVAQASVKRLSWLLTMISTVLMIIATGRQAAITLDSTSADALVTLSGNDAMASQLGGALTLLLIVFWAFLSFTFWSLGKLKNWARKATIGIFAVMIFGLAWNGILAICMSVALLQVKFVQSEGQSILIRIAIGSAGAALLLAAYGCWRLLSKLRTEEIRREFIVAGGKE